MQKELVFVLAPDSFKESMTAKEVCIAIETGIKKVEPTIECIHLPMADGGEGTLQALIDATNGTTYYTEVLDPLGAKVKAEFGIMGDEETAVIEIASASGLHLLPVELRNPLITSSYGAGQLIRAALDKKIRKLIIGIGGSATNDGGLGMLAALGGEFYTREGKLTEFGGENIKTITRMNLSNLDNRLDKVEIEIACDVSNPLCGPNGASYVFGPQKGATPEVVELLDQNLKHYAALLKAEIGQDASSLPGAGAAGGLGLSLMAVLNGEMKNGINLVMSYAQLEEQIKKADMVWTGEGSVDSQTSMGKTPFGVAKLAEKYKKPVIVLGGRVGEGIEGLYENGVHAIFSITQGATPLSTALRDGSKNTSITAENITRLLKLN